MQQKPFFKPVFLFVILGIICLVLVVHKNVVKDNIDPFSISLKSEQNTTTTLRQYLKDKPLVLVFWASWCGHCQHEVTVINQFYAKHPELEVLGIQVDDGKPNEVFQQAKYKSLNGAQNGLLVMQQFGDEGGGIPYIVVLDKHGKVIDENIGEISLDKLEKIASALN